MTRVSPLNADLHCHSLVSDGVLTPAQLAQRAFENGVELWSLTDHDELSGLAEAGKTADELGLPFIAGVEISASWLDQTVHIVGLNIDPGNPALNSQLHTIRAGRIERGKEMARRLAKMGVPDSYEGALKYAANPQLLSRTHFARYLVDSGVCRSLQEVFDNYLGDKKGGNVRVHWCRVEEAVAWIVGAGGRAVLAHPGRYMYTPVQADALYTHFRDSGGEGIEVVTGSHWPEQYAEYASKARYYGFLASRGSDFHAPRESRIDLGKLPDLPRGLKPVWHDWA